MKTITVEELKSKLDNKEDVFLLDVREESEHKEYNIGGTLLPLGKVQMFQLEDIEDHKEDEVVVYCRSGNRSMQASIILEQAGFKNVANLVGGMSAWKEKYGN
jgi:rhodanese-related sulfurtransferase